MVNLKHLICKAFCEEVDVSLFEGGFAVGTPFFGKDGDRLGLYVLGKEGGPYRVIDNALTISFLESAGVNLDNEQRKIILNDLLSEYHAQYDDELGEIFIEAVSEAQLPKAIIEFSSLLLRLNDFLWLTNEKTENTFRDDIRALVHAALDGKAEIRDDEPVSNELDEIVPDMVLTAKGRRPVALFIAQSDNKVYQAMQLKLIADYEKHIKLSVVALLEKDGSISTKVRNRADNRLDGIPRYELDKANAIQRVVREVVGEATFH